MDKKIIIIHPNPKTKLIQNIRKMGYDVTIIRDIDSRNYLNLEKKIDIKASKIQTVLPIWEGTVFQSSLLAESLGLRTNSSKSVAISRNKMELFNCLSKKGIPTAYSIKFNDIDSITSDKKLNFPIIIKPVSSTNSQGVIKINDINQLNTEIEHLKTLFHESNNRLFPVYNMNTDIIVQEYLEGREVNVDLLYRDNKYICTGIFEKEKMNGPYFPETGSFYPTKFTKDEEHELIELAWKGVQATGASIGAAHVEIRYTENGPKIIEIALRYGGAYTSKAIELLTGKNIQEELIKMLMSKDYFPNEFKFKGSCIYGGILAKKEGKINCISGVECLNEYPEIIEYQFVNNTGDFVKLPPNSSDPHILHYLLFGENFNKLLSIQSKIHNSLIVDISEKKGV